MVPRFLYTSGDLTDMHATRWLLVLLLLFGCAVRKRETKVENQPGTPLTTNLPEGVVVSRNKLHLVKVDPATLEPGEENEVSFTVVDANLEAVDLTKAKVEVTYLMPTMPQMGIFRAAPVKVVENSFDATLDIAHGGGWRVTVSITPEGATSAEETVIEYDVK